MSTITISVRRREVQRAVKLVSGIDTAFGMRKEHADAYLLQMTVPEDELQTTLRMLAEGLRGYELLSVIRGCADFWQTDGEGILPLRAVHKTSDMKHPMDRMYGCKHIK